MRVFFACLFSSDVRKELAGVRDRMHPRSGKATPEDNIHLTLRFIGEVEPSALSTLRGALARAAEQGRAFHLELEGAGSFRGGQVLWAGVRMHPKLKAMHTVLEKELEKIGYQPETRDYAPHITLWREAEGYTMESVKEYRCATRIGSLHLMESVREKGRLIYRSLYEVKLPEENT